MRTGSYKTRQRDIILELLKDNTHNHLTAEEITELLRNSGNKVGITTVYRYLEKLYSEGKVQKYTADKESARYTYTEAGCRGHFHLKCTECGVLSCADCDFLDGVCNHVHCDHGFTVDPAKTIFYGLCKKCSEKLQLSSAN